MTPLTDEMKQAIQEAVATGIKSGLSDPTIHCRYAISPEEHIAQHEAMARFIRVTGRIDDIKWSVIQKLVIAVILGIAGLAAYGAAVRFKLVNLFFVP